jgi:pilus assembly protein CpaE
VITHAGSRTALVVGGALGDAVASLAKLGFGSVERAADIGAAIESLRSRPVDLIVVPVSADHEAALMSLDVEARKSGRTLVIGTAPRLESDLILRAMRCGVHEFLQQPPGEPELAAAVARLMRRAADPGRRGEILAIYSAKGGLGCTTVAVNLATALAAADDTRRVALVDLVVGDGDVRLFLGIVGSYNLMDLVGKLDHADEELIQSLLFPAHGVSVLPSPENPELEDQIDGETTERLLDRLRMHFDFVVVDAEHHLSPRTLAVLDAADKVVVVTQLSVVALRSTQRTLGVFRELGYPDDKSRLVVNRYVRGDLLGRRDAAEVLSRRIFHSLPNDFEHANAALTKGVPIAHVAAESRLATEYAQFATLIDGSPKSGGELPVDRGREPKRMKRLVKRSKRV